MSMVVIPTIDGFSTDSDDYYDNAMIKQCKIIYDLMDEVPDHVIDEVFG